MPPREHQSKDVISGKQPDDVVHGVSTCFCCVFVCCLFGNWAGQQRGWGRHLQKQGALAGQAAGEPTEALARLWWCVRTTASTEQAGQGCEPGHAGVQAKASQDKVNWEKDSGGFMVCFLSF